MNADKWFAFEQRWIELEHKRKEYEFLKAQWSRHVRAEFPKGDLGDRQCVEFLVTKGFSEGQVREEILVRANVAAFVQDESTWNRLGGWRQLRCIGDATRLVRPITRKEIVEVIEAAKAEAYAPLTIMKKRGFIKPPAPAIVPPPLTPKTDLFPVRAKPRHDAYLDAVALAQFIAKTSKSVPRDILAIVNRYREFMRKAA